MQEQDTDLFSSSVGDIIGVNDDSEENSIEDGEDDDDDDDDDDGDDVDDDVIDDSSALHDCQEVESSLMNDVEESVLSSATSSATDKGYLYSPRATNNAAENLAAFDYNLVPYEVT